MNREELKQLLNKPYDRESWKRVITDVFPNVALHSSPQEIPCPASPHIEKFSQIGDVRLNDGRNLAVFEIKVSEKTQLIRNRVALRNEVSKYIDQQTNHGVLAVFDSHTEDYRFTFSAKETEFGEEGDLIEKETATKRFTYVLGPNESCRTPADRFSHLAQKKEQAGLDDVIEAFSVEKLNKEFFTRYKEHYTRFVDYLIGSDCRETVFDIPRNKGDEEKNSEEKIIRDFIKKLLGRIVFLHFLQKKGWLGCPPNQSKWENGDPEFILNLYRNCEKKENFHSKYLIPLFHSALNKKDRPGDMFELSGNRVPYLNGGLFEEDLPKARKIDFPSILFADLLDFFNQYNFTIDENDPEDREVGIDPEMLGHIFENLLEDNKDKGIFYTPKAIVQYMCRQSLAYYLKAHIGDHKEIDDLVHLKNRGDERDHDNVIAKNARQITNLLDEVKICDPAIGSGAFPIGLLKEIYWIKLTLDWTLDRAEVKRQIIQNSIYGVDIDLGAVEIARLRFWLALIVDEDEPRPLPNLDYKIMQGNSLLESFEGIRLDQILKPKSGSIQELGTDQVSMDFGASNKLHFVVDDNRLKEILKLKDWYFSVTDPEEKIKIHSKIDAFVLDHIDFNIEQHKAVVQDELKKLNSEIKKKQRQLKKYIPTKSEQKQKENLNNQLNACAIRKEKLHQLKDKPERPFFLWNLFFQDVFEKSGFDIVIANPPYVRQETIKDQKADLAKIYECYTGTADLFVYFYEQSVKLLKQDGVLTYITSNKYYRSAYGEKLRKYLTEKMRIYQMIDFGDASVFEAIAYASIIIGKKAKDIEKEHGVSAYVWQENDSIPKLDLIIKEKSYPVKQCELKKEGWNLESPEVLSLLEKLKKTGIPLDRYVDGKLYRGILTGLNEAFVIDRKTRDRLISEDSNSQKLIKNFLRGKDIKRWRVNFREKYLIKIESSENKQHPWSGKSKKEAEKIFLDNYPAIHNWLNQFRKKLIKRCDQGKYFWELRSCQYWNEFEGNKILTPSISNKTCYAIDKDGFFSNDKTNVCVTDDAEYICALLNSKVLWWVIKQTAAERQNGYYEFKPMYVSTLPIPNASEDVKTELSNFTYKAATLSSPELSQVEKKIEDIIMDLYGLNEKEKKVIWSKEKTDDLKRDLLFDSKILISELKKKTSLYFRDEIIFTSLEKLKAKKSSLKTYLSKAITDKFIFDAGKGWYSHIPKTFNLDIKPINKFIILFKKDLPLLDFSCWSTEQINPFTQHILNSHITFIDSDSDAIETIGEVLRDKGYSVFENPGKRDVEKNFRVEGKTVVIRPSITKQPEGEGHAAPIEKILVDLVWESSKLGFIDESEARIIADNATAAGRVNMAALLGYAKRRKVDISWLKTINQVQLNEKCGDS
ncbi:DUF6577 family protein [Fibrobacterota bacterium]